ncbi:MAG: hypothetical protein E3J72_08610 [Planctomycetota bacterium]|nr:MAG: hypothetical protein E3J72_08610 [Planctomycetota bacterium]
MADEKQKKDEQKIGRTRQVEDQPVALPGIRRFQSFTNVEDRMLTKNINRAAMFGVAAAMGVAVLKPLFHGMPQTTYCYECRACYATQDKCPGRITEQAELTVASRVLDYRRFILKGGMNCIRCGNCQTFCAAHLDLPKIFGTMQKLVVAAIEEGYVPTGVLAQALAEGKIGRDYLLPVVKYMQKLKKETEKPIPEPELM